MLLFLFCFAPDEIKYIQTSLLCALFVAEVCVCVSLCVCCWHVMAASMPACPPSVHVPVLQTLKCRPQPLCEATEWTRCPIR